MNKSLEMCMCHKLNRKMLRDSGRICVLSTGKSYYTESQTVLRIVTLAVGLLQLVDSTH